MSLHAARNTRLFSGRYGSCLAASAAIVIVLSGFAGQAWAQERPGMPRMVALERIDPNDPNAYTTLKLMWMAPESGSVDSYEIQYQVAGNNPWMPSPARDVGTALDEDITGLTEGVFYRGRVRAKNSGGVSGWVETGSVAPGGEPPHEPRNLMVTPGSEQLAVRWEPPTTGPTDGLKYCLTVGELNRSCDELISETMKTVTGLTNGVKYTVQVRTQRRQDVSDFIEGTGTPVDPADPPDMPTGLVLMAGNGQITASWRAPADDGGAPITDYKVEHAIRGSGSGGWKDSRHSGTDTTFTITGLTNGTEYAVRVSATNRVGTSAPTATQYETPMVPADPPGMPTDLELTPGDGQITASWIAPADGGARITDYKVEHAISSPWTKSVR